MEYLPDYYTKPILILGCGNPLIGDDGFGPAVVEYLENHCRIPSNVAILDVGTGVRELLFNILLQESKPEKIVIIDAIDGNRTPGEIFSVSIEDVPLNKAHDFSLHLMPTLNLLKELRDLAGVDVEILAAQPNEIPEEVKSGLSKPMQKAVIEMARHIELDYLGNMEDSSNR
jgi:coenzyme F420 hydrogenase subunit delta